jgi:hypothetical protein
MLFSSADEEVSKLTHNRTTMGIEELLVEKAKHYGILEGEERKSRQTVETAILNFQFSDEQAARLAHVSIEFVQKIRAELTAKNQ